MEIKDFRFYFGAASGSSRKALKKMDEPDVMISHHTSNNKPWPCESLFIDSGGFSLMQKKGEHPPTKEYLKYVKQNVPELWAYQDYPCEPQILEEYDRTVSDHIDYTVNKAYENSELAREMEIDSTPVVPIQGWEPNDYLECLDRLKDWGLVETDTYVAIGSVCGRNARDEIATIVEAISEELHPNNKLHAFGVKQDVLKYDKIVGMLDSADSLSYDWDYSMDFPGPRWQQVCYNYMEMKKRIVEGMGISELEPQGDRHSKDKEMFIETLNEQTGYEGESQGRVTKDQISHWAEALMKRHEKVS